MIEGEYFDGNSAQAKSARLYWNPATQATEVEVDGIRVACDIHSIQGRQIFLNDGASFISVYELPHGIVKSKQNAVQRWIADIELFSLKKAVVFVTIFLVFVVVLRAGVRVSTPMLVKLVPYELEQSIGQRAFDSMYDQYFAASTANYEQRIRLQQAYTELWRVTNIDSKPELIFVDSPRIGANALAFPGGPIVITDSLVGLLEDDTLILAVLAHELAHVEERHSMQQVMIVAGTTAVASMIFGAEEGLSEELVAGLANLYAFQHSQRFELASDAYAYDLLQRAGIDPAATKHALAKLLEEAPDTSRFSLFSTHPEKKERLSALEALAQERAQ